ncbi:hypothetical protein [Botrimarina hoheduenensis]|uniref:Uncharacterized protein n=1 Tax=Botrimarina hoheduenensis TaxID=2528000 RepID=A0A5C5W9H2_9BACT|nr:hypothetical protein [Botrimarina hoheduenensis]TWT46661.1 hypothetical protein Pla111_17620 [Botrimarina hoheduenensis]
MRLLGGVLGLILLGSTPAAAQQAQLADGVEVDDIATPDLVEVFRCLFDQERDRNYDDWPDRWTRLRDSTHPQYVEMEIDNIPADEAIPGRRMVIRPDGASARLTSPPILVMPKFSYLLTLRLKVERAVHGRVAVQMAFADVDGRILQLEESPPVKARGDWVELRIGAVQPQDQAIDRVYVHIDFDRGERGDLNAEVSIADVRLSRQPSIRIHTGSDYNVYTDPKDVVVTCSVSGILVQNPEIRFQLLDATNQSIGSTGKLEIDGVLISESATRAQDIVDGVGNSRDGYEGSIDWRPPIDDYGFYRVRVRMIGSESDRVIKELSTTVAVVREDLETTEDSEFGWSLPLADRPLSFPVLQELLPRVGVRYAKLPVWYAPGDEQRGDKLISFAEQLSARGIETVGILEDPTERIENPLAEGPPPPIQGLLVEDPSRWQSKIDHLITKLSLRIRWWQLGHDGDTSFVGYPNLLDKIKEIHHALFRFGQDVRLGLGWRWDHTQNWSESPLWDFEQMDARDGLNAAQLGQAFAEAAAPIAKRWVLVEPPQTGVGISADEAEEERRHQSRVRDFVEQILVAKVNHADAIFVANPFAGAADATLGRTGVMNDDGSPGELLLPWRTCARLLGGADYMGTLRLPSDSRNWLFKRSDGQVVLVVWSEQPQQEVLYLGDQVQVIDVWGKARTPALSDGRQVIEVDRMPRFVLGLSEPLARWRLETELANDRTPSVFSIAHPNELRFVNRFPSGVGGTFSIVPLGNDGVSVNSAIRFSPREQTFSLPAGGKAALPFDATLIEAEYGRQPLRIDFELTTNEDPLRFSVWRDLTVGQGDLELVVEVGYEPDGRFIVRQLMRSHSGRSGDFKCLLYAPPLRRKRTQVFQLGPQLDKKTYTFYQGEDLVGREMKLSIEEIDGDRELIKRFIVPPPPEKPVSDPSQEESPERQEFTKTPAPLAAAP